MPSSPEEGTSGGVYPIAACCFGDRLEAHFAQDPFFHPSSFAGSELGARVIEAVVERYEDPGLLEHVNEMGARLRAGVDELITRHPEPVGRAARAGPDEQAGDPLGEAHGLELTRQCFRHRLLAIFAFNHQATLRLMRRS